MSNKTSIPIRCAYLQRKCFIELLQAKNRKNEYKISKLFTEDALDNHVQISNDVHLAFEKFDARCRSR